MTTQTYEPNMILSNQEFDVVGTRPIRPDGLDKVTGKGSVQRGHSPSRYAARKAAAQSARPRSDTLD